MAEIQPKPLTAKEMFRALVQAGVFREDDGPKIRHVSIDLDGKNDLVVIHVTRYADRLLLQTAGLLARAVTHEEQVARTR